MASPKAISFIGCFSENHPNGWFSRWFETTKKRRSKNQRSRRKNAHCQNPSASMGIFEIWPRKKQPWASSKKTPQVCKGKKDLIYSRSKINRKSSPSLGCVFCHILIKIDPHFDLQNGAVWPPGASQKRVQNLTSKKEGPIFFLRCSPGRPPTAYNI